MANSEISVMGSNKKHVMEVGDGKTLALQIITYGSHFVSHDLKTFVATVCTQTCANLHALPHIPCIPRIHLRMQNSPRLLSSQDFSARRGGFSCKFKPKWMQKSLAMMRLFLATSVIELFHDSDVACHHGDTLARQAGMEI